MPLDTDSVFGVCYLSVAEFTAAAAIFGASSTIPADPAVVKQYLAAASRLIDIRTSKDFTPDADHTEQHTLDENGRVFVNMPPVISISDFRILTGSTSFSPIATTNLFINNQENWIDLLVQPFIFPGMGQVFIQITYKSGSDVKKNIKLATGYMAAAMMNYSSGLAQSLPGNIKSIKIGSMAQVTASDKQLSDGMTGVVAPAIVDTLLAGDMAVGIA